MNLEAEWQRSHGGLLAAPIIDWYEERIACSIETPDRRRLAAVRSRGAIPIFSREWADLHFDMVDMFGTTVFRFTRSSRGCTQYVALLDVSGRELARVQQVGPLWHRLFSHRMRMSLVVGGTSIATTRIRNRGYRRYDGTQEPVTDRFGREVARVSCSLVETGWVGNPLFEYRLDITGAVDRWTLLVVLFAHYLYSRTSHAPSPTLPRRF